MKRKSLLTNVGSAATVVHTPRGQSDFLIIREALRLRSRGF